MDFELLERGGPALCVLIALSVIAWGVVLERACFWIWRALWRDRRGVAEAVEHVRGRRFDAALARLDRLRRIPVARVLLEGVAHRGAEAAGRLEAAAIREHQAMMRNTGILDTVIAAAPLVGILGTVIGIIRSFQAFGGTDGAVPPPHRVIGGVSEALITTGAGLVVALVALVCVAAFRGFADRATTEVEQTVTTVESILVAGDGHAH